MGLTTTERRGRREVEQPKVGPKGETRGSERVKGHREHGEIRIWRAVQAWLELAGGFLNIFLTEILVSFSFKNLLQIQPCFCNKRDMIYTATEIVFDYTD
jgi:hypothetical protein